MHFSSQWFVAQGISSTRHGMDSSLTLEIARRGKRWVSPNRGGSDFPMRGFAVTVQSATGLVIEDAVGCDAQVLAGQVWITAEGESQDIIADAGTTVQLELGVRFNVSAFRDIATLLITVPRHLRDVGFSLRKRNGMRVLTVKAGSSGLPASLSGATDAIAAFARGCFAATQAMARTTQASGL